MVGPFTDLVQQTSSFIWEIAAANVPSSLHWVPLLITLVLVAGLYIKRRGHGAKGADGRERLAGLREYVLPKAIYSHESARVDLWLWIFERVLHPFWVVALLVGFAPFVEQVVISGLIGGFGASPVLEVNFAWMLLYSATILLVYDFFFYGIHFAMHKFPVLWAIHKVHHSAEVLTPLTRTREHFLAGPIWAAGAALGYALPGGVFAYLFNGNITQATLLNVGFFTAIFGLTGNFRHYHVAFHYPRWLCNWLQSPAMHHTHHSYLQKHWDTNLAAITSIWDRMFGTLYIPAKDEYTPWGLGPETQENYRSFLQNTVGPFRDWYILLRGGESPLSVPSEVDSDSSQRDS